MTMWSPDLAGHRGPRYRAIADALASDVRAGRLAPGARLPTHRDLAWRLGVTVGTVSRAYAEAERRGLIAGEVGRGTYVRPSAPPGPPPAASDAADLIDLSTNHGTQGSEARILAETLREIASGELDPLLRYQPHAGRPADRAAGARWIARSGIATAAERVVVTDGAQHALACVLAAIAEPGDTVLADVLSYAGMKAVAALLSLRLVGIAMDEEGMLPDAFEAACRGGRVKAVYLMPTLHNPTTAVTSPERRRAIARIAQSYDVATIEDEVYGFLLADPPPPVATLLPEHGFFITSTSKSFAPGLRVGYVHAPARRIDRVIAAMRATTWMATPLMAEIVSRWIDDGTGERLVAEKRAEAARRQALAARILPRSRMRMHPAALHLWLSLPEPWTAEDFAAAARRRRVAVTPAAAFAIGRGPVPNAVRVCLGTPVSIARLETGLTVLADLLAGEPDPFLSVV